MKNNLKTLLFAALLALSATGCSGDDEQKLPYYAPLIVSEDFEVGADESLLVTEGWTNYAVTGTAKWKIQRYSDNGYAEFNPYQSGNAVNVGLLISPAVTLEAGNSNKLLFQSAQSYVTSAANKLEVLISTDFDGTNVAAATWTPLQATLPAIGSVNFAFVKSGLIDLSAYSGTVHIGFKVTGSGTDAALDGAYQIDNVIIY